MCESMPINFLNVWSSPHPNPLLLSPALWSQGLLTRLGKTSWMVKCPFNSPVVWWSVPWSCQELLQGKSENSSDHTRNISCLTKAGNVGLAIIFLSHDNFFPWIIAWVKGYHHYETFWKGLKLPYTHTPRDVTLAWWEILRVCREYSTESNRNFW